MSKILGYERQFFDAQYLQQALSHRSYSKNNNERLEFLGDSVLNFVIAQWLYQKYPKISEGKLSRMRSRLVKGDTLAAVAKYYDLGEYLNLGIGELKSGGHKRDSVLADTVEAVFAAVLLDKGFNECEQFIISTMSPWLENVDPNTTDKDAKTLLQEHLQMHGLQLPKYNLINEFGKDHLKEFEVEAHVPELEIKVKSQARSIKKAEQACAKMILNKIRDNNE